MRTAQFWKRFWWTFSLIAGSAANAFGQTAAASISGRVTDPQGAVLIGATVELISVERGTTTSTTTNPAGIYSFPSVQPGEYRLVARSKGFKQGEVQKLTVDVGSSIEQNVQLELGELSQTVNVESTETLVNTVSPTVSSVVTGAPIQDLPLNGRDTLQLALTQPGIMSSAINTTPGPLHGVPYDFVVAGGTPSSVTYLLNGGNNTSVAYATPIVNPNPDTVAEFRILTNDYSAEYGRSAGGVVMVITKSGTNQLHGTAYDYLRNTDLNANNFFNQSGGVSTYQPRPVLNRNQFGFTTGGPLTLPKIVNGKDRFFFFFGYQGQRQTAVQVEPQATVYTPAELNGNFSHSVNNGPDPGVAAFLLSHPYYQPNLQLASHAIIDPARIDPAAQAYISNNLLPVSPTGILTPNERATDNRDEFTGKLDLHISSADLISLTLVRFHNPQLAPFGGSLSNPSGATVPGYASTNTYDNYFGNIDYTKIITPALLNNFHFTAQRQFSAVGKPVAQLPGPQQLGMKITPDAVTGPPQVEFNSSGFIIGEPSSDAYYADTTYVYADSATWNKGVHTLKFGGQLGFVQNNAQFIYEPQGFYNFYGAAGIGSDNDLADFLFGIPGNFNQWPRGFSGARSRQWAGYALDEWKVSPNLTLTLGGRYEYSTPKHDVQPRIYYLEPGLQSVKYPLAPEGILFPGDPGAPSGNAYNFPDRTNWAPRVGFAWDPSGKGKTSVRGGFGMFYDVVLALDSISENGTSPLLNQTFISFSPSEISANGPSMLFDDPYGSTGTINGFPSHLLSPNANFATAGLLPLGPGSVFVDTHQRAPYTFEWNLTVQRALGAGMALDVGYIGSTSRRLYGSEELDPFILGTTTRVLNAQPGLQYPDAYAQTPYTEGNYWGGSNYNGLLASLTKRYGDWHSIGHTFFTLSYTWSHNLDDDDGSGGQNSYYNNKQFYGPANTDIRNRLVLSGGWELPFAHMWSKGPHRLISGWSLYPIVTAQSGFPVDVTVGLVQDGVTPGPSGDGDQQNVRPYWSGGPVVSENPAQVQSFVVNGQAITGHFFFNPSGFVIPACFASSAPPGTPGGCPAVTYGGTQRNSFRGPGLTNFDICLEKRTDLVAERVQLVFRAEFFNVLNHTEWQPSPAYIVDSSLVGQITSTYNPRIGQLALKVVF